MTPPAFPAGMPMAGREMDARIAEQVMGERVKWIVTALSARDPHYLPRQDDGPWGYQRVPAYSTDIAAAWRVVARMREIGPPARQTLRLVVYPYNRTYATFDASAEGDEWSEANGEDATPLAICLAALAALCATPSTDGGAET